MKEDNQDKSIDLNNSSAIQQNAVDLLRKEDFDFALKAIAKGKIGFDSMLENLKIYQAELEIQNEELRHSQLIAETSTRRFSSLFASLPLPALVINSVGVVLECNEQAERQFSLQSNKLRSHFLPSLVHKKEHARLLYLIEQTKDLGQAMIDKVTLLDIDKQIFIADIHAALWPNYSDKFNHQLIITIVDQSEITAQQTKLEESQRHFMAYFNAAPMGMAATTTKKKWLEVNDKLCFMLGFSCAELLKMTWQDITHPDDLGLELGLFSQVIAGFSEGYQLDKRFFRKDGSILDAHVAVSCLYKPSGEIDYLITIIEDISARKHNFSLVTGGL
ncbi:MAG: PAS domain S-box protein [Methylovulum sp.]|nr:PAS domain S-box protein [Methylovulum sp.]